MSSKFVEQIRSWKLESDVDCDLLITLRGTSLIKGLEAIWNNDKSDLHRVVIEASQNGIMTGYAETVDSHRGFLDRYRSNCNWDEGISDSELYAQIGSWYFDSYQYESFEIYPEGVIDAEYDLWENLEDQQAGKESYHNTSVIGAALALERSKIFSRFGRSEDFELRMFDGNSYEWDANHWLQEERSKG